MGSAGQVTPFGHPMLEHFLLDNKYTNLNHGSYGTYPKTVRDQLRHYQDLAESHPDIFLRYEYSSLLVASRKAAAKIVNAPVDECVFVQNATTGVDTVLRNLVYKEGDVIIYFDTIYSGCERIILHLLETNPQLQAEKVNYGFPCSHDHIVESFLEVVKKVKSRGQNPVVAIYDTLVASPGVRFPFEQLTKACKEEGILSCIDAAHGIGHIKFDLTAIDPDFLVTNLHKWLFVPRSCALLYVATRNHDLIRTTFPTSHGFVPKPLPNFPSPRNPLPPSTEKSAFQALFQLVSTYDNAPYYTVPAAVAFREDVCGGEEKIYEYIKDIAARGGARMAQILGTEVMESPKSPGELTDCGFTTVRLPLTIGDGPGHVRPDEAGDVGNWIEERLINEYSTFIVIIAYRGRFWVRMSGQIYLEEEDFSWCAEVLRGLCERVKNEEHKAENK